MPKDTTSNSSAGNRTGNLWLIARFPNRSAIYRQIVFKAFFINIPTLDGARVQGDATLTYHNIPSVNDTIETADVKGCHLGDSSRRNWIEIPCVLFRCWPAGGDVVVWFSHGGPSGLISYKSYAVAGPGTHLEAVQKHSCAGSFCNFLLLASQTCYCASHPKTTTTWNVDAALEFSH